MQLTRRSFLKSSAAVALLAGCKGNQLTLPAESEEVQKLETRVLEGSYPFESIFNPSMSESGQYISYFEGQPIELMDQSSRRLIEVYERGRIQLPSDINIDFLYPQTPLQIVDRVKDREIAALTPPEGWHWFWPVTPTLTDKYLAAAIFQGDPEQVGRNNYGELKEPAVVVYDLATGRIVERIPLARDLPCALRSSEDNVLIVVHVDDGLADITKSGGALVYNLRENTTQKLPTFMAADIDSSPADISNEYIVFSRRDYVQDPKLREELQRDGGSGTSTNIHLFNLISGSLRQLTKHSFPPRRLHYEVYTNPRTAGIRDHHSALFLVETYKARGKGGEGGHWTYQYRGVPLNASMHPGDPRFPQAAALNRPPSWYWDADLSAAKSFGIDHNKFFVDGKTVLDTQHSDLYTPVIAAREANAAVFGTRQRHYGRPDRSFLVFEKG